MAYSPVKERFFLTWIAMAVLAASTAVKVHGALVKGQLVNLDAKALKSSKASLAFPYYSLPFCKPAGGVVNKALSFGDALKGDRLLSSVHQFEIGKDESCKVACTLRNLTQKQAGSFCKRVEESYMAYMSLAGVPVAMVGVSQGAGGQRRRTYSPGFPLGKTLGEDCMLYNHLVFNVAYYPDPRTGAMSINAVTVNPTSMQHNKDKSAAGGASMCNSTRPQFIEPGITLHFTYDVSFHAQSSARRFDSLVAASTSLGQSQWASIYNTLLVALFLAFVVGALVKRTVHSNVFAFTRLATHEEARELFEDMGWKVLHGDVLRPPPCAGTLAVFVGTGVQLACATMGALLLSQAGLLSPAYSGSIEASLPFLWLLSSVLGGFSATRLARAFHRQMKLVPEEHSWQVPLGVATLFPSVALVLLFTVNALRRPLGGQAPGEDPPLALPTGTGILLLLIWGASSVFTFLGSSLAELVQAGADPLQSNPIPRPIPAQPWYMWAPLFVLVGGLLPFGITWGEVVQFVDTQYQGTATPPLFPLVHGPLVVVALAELAVLMCFLQLSKEDYRWWWRSFLGVGSAGLYAFMFGITEYMRDSFGLMGLMACIDFFARMVALSLYLFFVFGAVGVYSSCYFVRYIYSRVPQ